MFQCTVLYSGIHITLRPVLYSAVQYTLYCTVQYSSTSTLQCSKVPPVLYSTVQPVLYSALQYSLYCRTSIRDRIPVQQQVILSTLLYSPVQCTVQYLPYSAVW